MEGTGALLTLVGVISLFMGARSRYREARAQLGRALQLNLEEAAERATAQSDAERQAVYELYVSRHLANGLPRPAGYGHSYQPGYETVNIMRVLGDGALRDLIIASLGVALSGVAGVLANLFPVS
ncbi:hypothetical protein [Microbacterium plantarum]